MKHTVKVLAALVLSAAAIDASAQKKPQVDPEGYLTYSLPLTTITLEVEAVQEKFYAGPYAKYAEKYLGIKARQKDETTFQLTEITMTPYVEADQDRRYTVQVKEGELDATFLKLSSAGLVSFADGKFAEEAAWRFPVQRKGDFSDKGISPNLTSASTTLYKNSKKSSGKVSVQQQNVVVEKSLEKKASETADLIFKLRQQRLKIVTGDTDANYSGEAMGAALNELSRLEEEYMTLFLGYSETQTQRMKFEVIPQAGRESQMYVAFRLSDTAGLVPADNLSGKPIIMEITVPEFEQIEIPEVDPKKAKKEARLAAKHPARTVDAYYCIPAMCSVKLMDGMNLLLQDRLPIYQLGQESSIPVNIKFAEVQTK